ncbi:hypothetical protein [Mycobacterium shimoidei]|uniref:hypothetical protein n=1 Tax=Mycobacterium shimoidei TaxID=29313 RepID=UPI0008489544|nr:hypothetical protein [Mycobacterium shimoidei]MCV7261368.1 hypothetical protein [Mycobacterium shimoidei]ODR09223.1 hypothetical protein BHQ16_19780 [Mycobacterium shimoidei]ORW77440.1 hypothetical protein AWC26_19475 [Mycobacterium shimoidei]
MRRLNDVIEALGVSAGPPRGVAIDALETLAWCYGEALARLIARLAANPTLLPPLTIVHELGAESDHGRVLRVTAELAGPSGDRGGQARLTTLERTMPLRRLPPYRPEAISVADIVRKAVLAAAPELSTVTVESLPRRPGVRSVRGQSPKP